MWTRMDRYLGVEVIRGTRVASVPSQEGLKVWIVEPHGVWWCSCPMVPQGKRVEEQRRDVSFCTSVPASLGAIHDVARMDTKLWLATDRGLFVLRTPREGEKPSPPLRVSAIDATPVLSVAANSTAGIVAVGTDTKLFVSLDGGTSFHFFFCGFASEGGDVDANVTALAFDHHGDLWIGTPIRVQVLSIDTLAIIPLGGRQGLPYGNITCASSGAAYGGDMWLGTKHGVIRHQTSDPRALSWNYFNGPRWIPGYNVSDVLRLSGGALVGTEAGITFLAITTWTLAKKARHYQSIIYPRHDRYGLVANGYLTSFGDLRTYKKNNNDNDGEWTSVYLASQAFRYAATKDPDAKRNVWKHFAGMEFQNLVTGVPGLMARSFVKEGESYGPDGEWHNSTAYPGWIWKGDTSSDEMTGHLFVYPLVLDFVSETEEEKERVRKLIDEITGHLVDNGFYLLDLDGKPTTYGQWAPEVLNAGAVGFKDDRGLNSLQAVGYLVSAYRVTNEEKYLKALRFLVEENGYDINLVNAKMLYPSDINYSDDELMFFPYYTYFHAYKMMTEKQRQALPKNLHKRMEISIRRAWDKIIRYENASQWSAIYFASGAFDPEAGFGLDGSISTLRQWALEQIDWPVENAQRTDVILDPFLSRFGEPQALNLLSYAERIFMRWNASPFDLNRGSGFAEYDPSAWLLPYWLSVYHGLIVDVAR
eukprot:TRINITY_DN27252_c0_g1_i1.p1 TRINITY_DN27252_c0_g1~~TRINITY_DN27252_c0_g1_i1.p1  ORF type:complete len:818 (+),score=150.33 TRINITY_DN27252_c0_g1_i1:348-2456(+)